MTVSIIFGANLKFKQSQYMPDSMTYEVSQGRSSLTEVQYIL